MTTHQQRKLTDSWLPQPAHEEIQRPPLKPSIGAVRDGLRESLGLQPSMFDELETAPDPAGLIVASVGYRGWGDPAGLFAALVADGVRIVVDVRWMPWGRNRAYAPKRLQAAGRLAGVEYQHLRSLGNRALQRGQDRVGRPSEGPAAAGAEPGHPPTGGADVRLPRVGRLPRRASPRAADRAG